jgi:hypothetical protein
MTVSVQIKCPNRGLPIMEIQLRGAKHCHGAFIILPVTLDHVASNRDIWDILGSLCTGDALSWLAPTPYLRATTIIAPAFTRLAGCDNDGNLVPWNNLENVMIAIYIRCTHLCTPLCANSKLTGANRGAVIYLAMNEIVGRTAPVGCGLYRSV